MKNNILMRFSCTLLFLALLVVFINCNSQKNESSNRNNDTGKGASDKLSARKPLKEFDKLFLLQETIPLQESEEFSLGTVNDIQIDSAKNIFILDKVGKQVQMFNRKGDFLRRIGKQGYGPGEYASIKAMYCINNSIYIADVRRQLIHHYTNENAYVKSIKMASWNCYKFFVNASETRFYLYDPVVTEAKTQKQIVIQDAEGKLIKRFCPPSILAQKGVPCPNYGFSVAADGSLIAQVNAHEYKISVYDENGKITNTITNAAGLSECKSLPADFPVTRNFSEAENKKFRSAFNWINKLYFFNDESIIITYLTSIRPNPIVQKMDILTLKGDFIGYNLTLPASVVGVSGKYLYTTEKRKMQADGNLTPVKINVWKLQ